jgi:hypothetical protein
LAITKEPMQTAPGFGQSSPHPWFCPVVELHRRHLHGSFNLISIGEALSSERITTEEAPPAFLEVEPAGTLGNEGSGLCKNDMLK